MRHFGFKLLVLTALLSLGLFAPTNVRAEFNIPNFPSCPNRGGETVASYSTGDHAIVSIEGLKKGSDSVYSQGNDNFAQCYCPTDSASGIQTNWLAAGQISKEDQNDLITKGWVLIPNGADWGLSAQPYLGKNISFSCNGGSNGGSSGGSGGSSSGGSSGGSSSSGGSGGSVLGVSVLAATSSSDTNIKIAALLLLGLSLMLTGIFLKKHSNGKV